MNYSDKKESGEVKDLEMAEQQLRNIHANVIDLLEHLQRQPHCPLLSQAWVQSKLHYRMLTLTQFATMWSIVKKKWTTWMTEFMTARTNL